jgi:hypothetical protein
MSISPYLLLVPYKPPKEKGCTSGKVKERGDERQGNTSSLNFPHNLSHLPLAEQGYWGTKNTEAKKQ